METEKYHWVKTDGLLDVVNGVNLWIWDQTTPTPGYTGEARKTACTRPFSPDCVFTPMALRCRLRRCGTSLAPK